MGSRGTLTLHRFNGDEQFNIASAEIDAWKTEDGVELNFEIQAEKPPIKTLPDTASLFAWPGAEATVALENLDADDLVGRTFKSPGGVNEDHEWVGRFYYCEHENMEENVIEILERKQDWFRIRWTGTTIDVNFYDDSKPRTTVEVDAWFHFEKMAEWSKSKV